MTHATTGQVSLDVIILTYNEERHIARAIASVSAVAARIFVVDSFSTDRTVEIARELGATVVQHPFVNQAKQFQWALDSCALASDWILRLDADEIIEPDLAAEIAARLPKFGPDITGVNLKRKHVFLGRWIRHGGRYPVTLLRIFRRGLGQAEDRWMDEHIFVSKGQTVTLEGGFADHNLNDLTHFTDKHNKYASREAMDVLSERYALNADHARLSAGNTSRQAFVKRLVKKRVYNKLPFWLGPLGYFLFRMTVQLGFLDGRPGLVYHFLQGFWYRFLVGAKIYEYDLRLRNLPDQASRSAALHELTGFAPRPDVGRAVPRSARS